jgi:hypothetical protein
METAMRTQFLVGAALTVACGCGDGGPVAPQQPLANTVKPAPSVVQAKSASNASPTHGLALTCFAGPCGGAAGTVNFSGPARPVVGAAPGFGVAHEGVYAVHGAPPNTVYLLQRAIDINVNGVCTGTFITWPFPPTQPMGDPSGPPPARLTTSPAGAGAAHFTFEFAGGNPALHGEIIFRLIEESPNPGGTELRTACVPNTR